MSEQVETWEGETMPDREQTIFPFYLNETKLAEFLTRHAAIEDEEDHLREEKRLLKDEHADHFPMRAVLTAVKVVRARRKLEQHHKEPMQRASDPDGGARRHGYGRGVPCHHVKPRRDRPGALCTMMDEETPAWRSRQGWAHQSSQQQQEGTR